MINICRNRIKAKINPIGAELEALYVDDINILWERKENIWNSQSPILFPIVGGLKDGYYVYNGNEYKMPPHGFVRNKKFDVDNVNDNQVILSLLYDDESIKIYPFKFKLIVTYTILLNELDVSFEIVNLDNDELYFSIGFHPGFSYEGLNKAIGNDISLKVNNENLNEVIFSPSYVLGMKKRKNKTLKLEELTNELTIKRTICLENATKVELKGQGRIVFETDMKYFAFWQKTPEDHPLFICVEGWNGLPDCDDTNHNIKEKMGIIKLGKNNTHKSKFKIILERKL